jgi:DNA-binding protein H-NS
MPMSYNFSAMSIDALWQMHEEMRIVLAAKMTAQRQEIDERLHDLEQFSASSQRAVTALRPKAGPFYRNPDRPTQIWSGRGLRPRWLVFQLASGRKLDEFRVDADSSIVDTDDGPAPRLA